MLDSLNTIFINRQSSLDESDIRHFVQAFLRDVLHTEALYCERARDGLVVIRVSSPALFQEVFLLEHDVSRALQQLGFSLRKLSVIRW
jgi:hypothetical protein